MKRYLALGAIAALGLAANGCGEETATAELTSAKIVTVGKSGQARCNPGEWVKTRYVEPNGDVSTGSLRASLPEGTSLEGSDGVTIYWDGRVEAPQGTTVECLKPTH